MSDGTGETMTSRRAQIGRLRRVAVAALDRYPLPAGRLTFVTHGENTTFRHDSTAGRYLVRVHRPQRHGRGVDSAAAIRSEIAWLQAIRAETELAVPQPWRPLDGSTTVEASAAGETRVCSVLRWMDGRIHESSPRPVHLRRLGAAMARLHHQADGWTPPADFVRIHWDHETFFGDVMVYGEHPGRRVLGPAAAGGPHPLRGSRRPTGRGDAAGRRRRAHPRRSAPRQRALPARRGQADRLRRLRHGPPSVRARGRPLGAAATPRIRRCSATPC